MRVDILFSGTTGESGFNLSVLDTAQVVKASASSSTASNQMGFDFTGTYTGLHYIRFQYTGTGYKFLTYYGLRVNPK
jgi:hypothetical protein